MSETLYRKYRSRTFAELVGQGAIARTLRAAVRDGRVSHAYLFTGIRGTGKTSAARILARAVNCLEPDTGEPCNRCEACQECLDGSSLDVIEIDAATNRGIDEIRDLRERVRFLPAHLRRKVYIVDEAHMLTDAAANAFLKTLEEPPPHVCFILATTEPHKLVETVLSRCQRYDFLRIDQAAIAAWLAVLCEREGVTGEADGLALIADAAQGSMRDAISLLDRVIGLGEPAVTGAQVSEALGLVDPGAVGRLALVLAGGDPGRVLRELEGLHARGADPRQLLRALAEVARSTLAGDPASGLAPVASPKADTGGRPPAGFWAQMLAACAEGMVLVRRADDPRLALEVVLLRLALGDSGGEGAAAPPPPVRRARGGGAAATPPSAAPVPLTAAPPFPSRPPIPAAAAAPAAEEAPPGLPVPISAADPAPGLGAVPGPDAAPAPAPASPDDPPAVPPVAGWEVRWVDVLEQVRRRHVPTQALLKAAVPVAYEEGRLTIAVAHAFHLQQIGEPGTRRLLEDACAEVVGRPVTVDLVRSEPAAPPLPAAASGASLRTALDVFPGSRVARSQFRDR